MGAPLLFCVIAIMATGVTALPNSGLKTWSRFSKLPFPSDKAFLYDTFPEGFMWAVGTAAYPVEGAFEKDGKGLSIWDTFTRSGKRVLKGDVGSDSYHNVPSDIRAIEKLGVTHYRFSLSWARIFPNGTRGSYNEIGTKYYRTLIKKLKEIRVQPVVTLYHWDLPEHLQQTFGGWTNPLLVDIFRDYADFCFHTFGDDVKYWITIDNPFVVAQHGYGTGKVAPGIKNDGDLPFRVGHILLKAHAAVWHRYHSHYRHRQKGRISMALASHWINPSRTRRESLVECQCSLDHVLGWFARPLFTDGDYPPCMKERLGSKLPSFTQEEKDYIRGTADFFALSHAALSFQLVNNSLKFGQQEDLDLRMLLYWVNAEYDKPPIFIVQSGWYVLGDIKTEDPKNMYYIKRFIAEALKSIVIDHVNVIGYTAWSLIDGFEWYWEYGIRRGLYYIDFSTPEMKREPKTSATFYRNVIHSNGFPELPENKPVQGVFPCDFAWGVSANSIQVETMPTQFADPNVYLWNIYNNGELIKMEGVNAPPLKRNIHCADYATIRQQVDEIRHIGVNHFHFSLNWSALVPSGDVSHPNDTLLGFYRCFTQQLLQANVTPVVTLWHHTKHLSSLPASLNNDNKWLNSETPKAFADYARLCYRELGEHVKMWVTLNEPNDHTVCYEEAHQMLIAHALAWRVYDQEFRPLQGGQVSLVLHMYWAEPAVQFSREDVVPAKRVLDFRVGWFAEPVFGSGDYPLEMRRWLRQLNSVSLPVFNKDDKELVKGSYDFFAISHFTTKLITRAKEDLYTYTANLEVQHMTDTTWIMSPMDRMQERPVVPWGLRKALNWVKEHYGHVPVYVMANGVQENPAHIKDSLRVYYLYNYINEALKAYTLDGVNLKGYFTYALNDQRDPGFGLYGNIQEEVIIKASLSNYRNIIQHNGFPIPGAEPQQCLSRPQSCLSCQVLLKKPVMGFLSLVGSVMLITLGLIIYYTAKRHKDSY